LNDLFFKKTISDEGKEELKKDDSSVQNVEETKVEPKENDGKFRESNIYIERNTTKRKKVCIHEDLTCYQTCTPSIPISNLATYNSV